MAVASCGSGDQAAIPLNAPDNLALSPEPDPGLALERIPESFLGRWAGENHTCTRSPPDIEVMVVEPRKIVFWNSFAQVLDVTALDNSQLVLNLEVHESEYSVGGNSGSGPVAESMEMILRLSEDQEMLTAIVSGRGVQVRHRCPLP